LSSEAKPAETYVEKPKTLAALRAEIAEGRTKAVDLAASYYDRIAQVNPRLNVYLSLTKERALAQAARIDDLAAKGDPLPPLAGIPVGIKDVLVVKGAPRVQNPQRLPAPLRCDGCLKAGSCGRGAARQAQLR